MVILNGKSSELTLNNIHLKIAHVRLFTITKFVQAKKAPN